MQLAHNFPHNCEKDQFTCAITKSQQYVFVYHYAIDDGWHGGIVALRAFTFDIAQAWPTPGWQQRTRGLGFYEIPNLLQFLSQQYPRDTCAPPSC